MEVVNFFGNLENESAKISRSVRTPEKSDTCTAFTLHLRTEALRIKSLGASNPFLQCQ
jgi:hypothetical protein